MLRAGDVGGVYEHIHRFPLSEGGSCHAPNNIKAIRIGHLSDDCVVTAGW